MKKDKLLTFKLLLALMVFYGCECAETTYTNIYFNPDEYNDVNPYQAGDEFTFVSKSNQNNRYKLLVEERNNKEWEHTSIEANNTHLGLFCKEYDPLIVQTTVYNQTRIRFGALNTIQGNQDMGIFIGGRSYNAKPYFCINNYIPDYYSTQVPEWQYQNLSLVGINQSATGNELDYPKIDLLNANNDYKGLYLIDTLSAKVIQNGGLEDDIYFLEALYSTQYGFVRFITEEHDTLDLIRD